MNSRKAYQRVVRWALVFPLALSVGGCGTLQSSAREVSLAEFAQQPADVAVETDEEADAKQPADVAVPDNAAPPRTGTVTSPPVVTAVRPGERVVVESLVGQVNGRPIFADEFLEPLADRLRAAAAATTGRQRAETFRLIINANLETVVENELILAEAEAALTPEQQLGLFALVRSWQEELIRKGHTRSDVESAMAREGMTLDEFLDSQKQALLVRELAREKVTPRVIVSWRDVEREYQRRFAEFNPSAEVTLARIRLITATQAEQIQDVTARLEAGESFAVIADELGFPRGGEWSTFEMGPGGITDIAVSPQITSALEGLEAGDTTAPLAQGSVTLWLHVVELDRPMSQGLYDPDVQRRLLRELRARREDAEWNRYIDSLLERGIYDELAEMANRLFEIAMERFGR